MPEAVFGRFHDLVPLGEGGMGHVFLARAVGPGGFSKPVVIKRMRHELAGKPALVERFLREARVQARLSSPNVIQVIDFGRIEDTYFLVLEHVHGVDLMALVRRAAGPLPIGVAVRIAADACRGLEHAHGARGEDGAPLQLVHRDVSPQNVLVSFEGDVKLGDFGLARIGDARVNEAGLIYGKPAYLPPELPLGLEVDARSDVYSLGLVLYFLLTGVEPYRADTRAETLARVVAARAEPVGRLRPEAPEALAALVARAIDPTRTARFLDATAMLSELEEVAIGHGPLATTRAVRDLLAGLYPGAATEDPWAIAPKAQPLELSRLVAPDGITELTVLVTAPEAAPGTRVSRPGAPPEPAAVAPRPPWRRWQLAVGACLVLGLGALGVTVLPRATARLPERAARAASPEPRRVFGETPEGAAPTKPVPRREPSRSPGDRAVPENPARSSLPMRPAGERARGTAAPAMGRLRVGTAPGWGWVWVDGRRVGATPVDVQAPAGARTVRVVSGETDQSVERVVEVRPDAPGVWFVEPFE